MKIKLFFYHNYQYKLLEEELNQLGAQGYKLKNIGRICFFQKTNKPLYYTVQLYKKEGRNRVEKYYNTELFLNKFLEKDFSYKGRIDLMHVFMGDENKTFQESPIDMNNYFGFKYSVFAAFFIMGFALLLSSGFVPTYISSYLTNGSLLLHFIPYFIFLFFGYYFSVVYINHKLLNKKIDKLKEENKYKKEKKLYKIHNIIFIVITVITLFSIFDDSLQRKTIDIKEHPIITLKDLGMNNYTTEYSQTHSLLIPTSYQLKQEINKEKYTFLQVSEYKTSHTQMIIDKIMNNPEQVIAKKIEKYNENRYIGTFEDNKITTYIIKEKDQVIVITTTIDLRPYLDQIEEFYK